MGVKHAKLVIVFITCVGCGCTGATSPDTASEADARAWTDKSVHPAGSDEATQLSHALSAVRIADYAAAEETLVRLSERQSSSAPRARLALAELELMTGRYERASAHAQSHCSIHDPLRDEACSIAADALSRQGNGNAAIALLQPLKEAPQTRRLQLTLADTLAESGRGAEARVLYQQLVADFTAARIADEDAIQLAITGRAAQRMGALADAHQFFNRAERTGVHDLTTLLWRGEFWLDAHDPKRARDLADAALGLAPNHPRALLYQARVLLASMKGAEQIELLVGHALRIDPKNAEGHAILAGLALHDLDFARAQHHLQQGLALSPRNSELHGLRAAACFLIDDTSGYEAAMSDVHRLQLQPAKVYRLTAEYAEKQQRYDSAINLLRRAIALDPEAAQGHAQLGTQLLRSGREAEGRRELKLALERNPFDRRASNSLALFEQELDAHYGTMEHGRFAVRVPNRYRETLRVIVLPWLETARKQFERRWGKLSKPLRVELYVDQESFGVRTSGVPDTSLDGACFGTTIVARLPGDEPTNLGMTLWHEMSHAYHLQLSKQRVPRWFTEGLAQIETSRQRKAWSHEQELTLYRGLREGLLPDVSQLNRAFSRADSAEDLAFAYVASAYLVDYLERSYGFERLRRMLEAWGKSHSTVVVVREVLGIDLRQLDEDYRTALREQLAYLGRQYVPSTKLVSFEHTLSQGSTSAADTLWIASTLELANQRAEAAAAVLTQMIDQGNDGYFVRLQLALVARMRSNLEDEQQQLQRAHDFLPTATEPLFRLAAIANAARNTAAELAAMEKLSVLEESNLQVQLRLVELYLELGRAKSARTAAADLVYVDPLSLDVHRTIARVAQFEHDTAHLVQALRHLRALVPRGTERDQVEDWILRATKGYPIEFPK